MNLLITFYKFGRIHILVYICKINQIQNEKGISFYNFMFRVVTI
jgi:hypothetical protein